MASVASEVALKTVLLKLIVYGLVHSESLAGLVTETVIKHRGYDQFRTLLLAILKEYGGIDLKVFKRVGATKDLWDEILEIKDRRDAAVHRAEMCDNLTATQAIEIATTLLSVVFPQLLAELGLHLHDGHRVCNKVHLDAHTELLLQQLGFREGA